MIGIAFDFSWAPFMTFDQNSSTSSAHWKRGSKKQWPAGNDLLRLIYIRHDLLVRWSALQALRPASASEAPISLKKSRRLTPSNQPADCCGNSCFRSS